MHIVWINDHADFTGGCEQYIFQTTSLLRSKGIRCTLLYTVGCPVNPKFTNAFDGAFPNVEPDVQIRELNADLLYIHRLERIESLKELLALPIIKVRFYHDHKLFCLREHKYTALMQRTCTKKVGLGCYKCLGFVNRSENGFKIKPLSTLEKELAINRRLDYFVVGSSYMAEHLRLHDFDESRILSAPLYTNVVSDLTLIEKNNDDIAQRNILFVGQLIRGKGLDTLISSMELMEENVVLNICGTGRMESNYREQVNSLKLNERVNFEGYKTTKELDEFYKSADIVAIPARAPETFCLVGIEALLHGKPIVATNVGGMSDWFKPNHNGLEVSPNDAKGLAKAIDNILRDKDTYRRFVNNIEKDDYSKFSPKNHTQLLVTTFSNLLEAS